MGVHGSDFGGVALWIQEAAIASWGLVAAIERCATAPATAPGDLAVHFNNKVGSVINELGIEPHDHSTRLNLPRVEEGFLKLCNRGIHQGAQGIEVCAGRQSVIKTETSHFVFVS
jgi:hypothetical protein